MNTPIPEDLTYDYIKSLIKNLKTTDLRHDIHVNVISHYAVRIIDNLHLNRKIMYNSNGELNSTKTSEDFVELYHYFEDVLTAQYEPDLNAFIQKAEQFMSKLAKVDGYKKHTVRYNNPNSQLNLASSRPGTPIMTKGGKYKKTDERIVLKGGAKRVVYTGKRGGRYIKVDGKFKLLCSS